MKNGEIEVHALHIKTEIQLTENIIDLIFKDNRLKGFLIQNPILPQPTAFYPIAFLFGKL